MVVEAHVREGCYSRGFLELVVGRGVKRVFECEIGRPPQYVLRVDLLCGKRKIFLSLRLNREPLHKRDYYTYKHPAPLNPIIAAAMVYLADIKDGEIILDRLIAPY
ncbi:MAG: hypothetical protein DRJ59_01820, partial [Thermoprotei archaeon]